MLKGFLLGRLSELDWARVFHLGDAADIIITKSVYMHSIVLVEIGTPDVAIEADSVLVRVLWCLNDIESVSHHVGVLEPPAQVSDLLDRDEACQIIDLSLGIGAIALQSREVKEFGTIMNLLPESLLHSLLRLAQLLVQLVVVKMSKHAHHIGHTMVVKQAKEFEGLHLKTNACINQEQGKVDYFSHIYHRLHVGRTLHKSDSLVLVSSQSDRSSHVRHFLFRKVMHE